MLLKDDIVNTVERPCKICNKPFKQHKKKCGRYRNTCSQECRVVMIQNYKSTLEMKKPRVCEFCGNNIRYYARKCDNEECNKLDEEKVNNNILKYARGKV